MALPPRMYVDQAPSLGQLTSPSADHRHLYTPAMPVSWDSLILRPQIEGWLPRCLSLVLWYESSISSPDPREWWAVLSPVVAGRIVYEAGCVLPQFSGTAAPSRRCVILCVCLSVVGGGNNRDVMSNCLTLSTHRLHILLLCRCWNWTFVHFLYLELRGVKKWPCFQDVEIYLIYQFWIC